MLHIPIAHARDVSKQIPREKNFSAIFHFGILLLKNWLRLRRQFKLNMESFEPADEEELSTFSLGMEFLTPQKERKENKEQARPVLSRFANHRVENVTSYLDERTLTYEPIVNC